MDRLSRVYKLEELNADAALRNRIRRAEMGSWSNVERIEALRRAQREESASLIQAM